MQQNPQQEYRLEDILDKIPFTCRLLIIIGLTTWLLDFTGFTSSTLINNDKTLSSL